MKPRRTRTTRNATARSTLLVGTSKSPKQILPQPFRNTSSAPDLMAYLARCPAPHYGAHASTMRATSKRA